MKLDLKLNFGKSGKKIQLGAALAQAWKKSFKLIFFFCLMGVFIFGWQIWQKSLSGNSWSAEKKQEYLNSQNTEILFNQKNFEKVLENVEARKQASMEQAKEFRDIFKGY